jgi:tetratricopeptide (TPR) repeat protein
MAAALLAAVAPSQAHEHGADTVIPEKVGSVAFATSCSPKMGADFNRGVALIHSFWHDEARRSFDKVAAADPECAMAYWGQAMASFHLYSSTPSADDLKDGRAALARAATARKKSPREIAYLRAVETLYDGFNPSDYIGAATRYATAMGELAQKYPQDLEATAFYALALLAAEKPGDTSLTNARKAVALLNPLLKQHPDHPGLAHYVIHACDNPQMSDQGVEAARTYAQIAPAAPHALHMPSHIFARRGLWDDDIRSNLASKAAADNPKIGGENKLHAMEFLEYAYLQTGQFDKARAIADEAKTVKADEVHYHDYYLTVEARFPALLAIESQGWTTALNLQPIAGAHWYSHATTLLANAIAAGHMRNADAATQAAKTFDTLTEKFPERLTTGSSSAHLRDEVHAWAFFARGDTKSAIDLLRPIADRQEIVGKGEVELPAREMLAEMLLIDGKAREALDEYQRSLKSDPNRFNALLGAAKAAEQVGDTKLAAEHYKKVLGNSPAGSGAAIGMLSHARSVAGL